MNSHHASSGRCHRCGRGGHLARECSLHICFRCNGKGHMAWECVEGITCSRCGEKGHLQRNCKKVSCHKCGRKGHISKFCNDPFVKAEETKRLERQRIVLKPRIAASHSNDQIELTSGSAIAGSPKLAPGPWDGLGKRRRDRMCPETRLSSLGNVMSKSVKDGSQGSVFGKVNILTVKRKIYSEESMQKAKRRVHPVYTGQKTDVEGHAVDTSFRKDTTPEAVTPQWSGLLGYGSEDSRSNCYSSSDVDSEGQICSSNGRVQAKLIRSADEVFGTSGALHASEEPEPSVRCQASSVDVLSRST